MYITATLSLTLLNWRHAEHKQIQINKNIIFLIQVSICHISCSEITSLVLNKDILNNQSAAVCLSRSVIVNVASILRL